MALKPMSRRSFIERCQIHKKYANSEKRIDATAKPVFTGFFHYIVGGIGIRPQDIVLFLLTSREEMCYYSCIA